MLCGLADAHSEVSEVSEVGPMVRHLLLVLLIFLFPRADLYMIGARNPTFCAFWCPLLLRFVAFSGGHPGSPRHRGRPAQGLHVEQKPDPARDVD